MPIATFVNAAAVIVGSLIGLLLKRAIPKRIEAIVFDAMGLATIALAITMILKVENFLFVFFSVVIGGIVGVAIGIADYLERFGETVKIILKTKETRFTEGMVTAFLLFCIGPMTIIGSLNEGLVGDRTLILTKAMMDGFTSIIFATTYGIGVAFASVPLLLFQGGLTILAAFIGGFFSQTVINQLTAVAGVLLLGVGINLLGLKKISVANLLPALLVIVVLSVVFK